MTEHPSVFMMPLTGAGEFSSASGVRRIALLNERGEAIDLAAVSDDAVNIDSPTKELAYNPDVVTRARSRRRRYLDVTDYASISTGWAQNSHAAILNAIASDPAFIGMDIYLPDTVQYELDATVSWKVSILGSNVGPTIVGDDSTVVTPSASFQGGRVLTIEGYSVAPDVLLTADAPANQNYIDVASIPAGLARGALIVIKNTQPIPGIGSSSGSASSKGEMMEVASISGTRITFTESLGDSYTVADGTTFRRHIPFEGGRVDLTIHNKYQVDVANYDNAVHYAQMLLYRSRCRGFRDNVRLHRSNSRGYALFGCYDGDIDFVEGLDHRDRDSNAAGGGALGYVVDVQGVSRHLRIDKIVAERSRHGFTNTKGPEAPRDISVNHIYARDMTSAAVDTHPEGFNIRFGKIVIPRTYSTALQVRAQGVTVDSLEIGGNGSAADGWGSAAVWLQAKCSINIKKVIAKNLKKGIYNFKSSDDAPLIIDGAAVRVDPNVYRSQIDHIYAENCDGPALVLAAQATADGFVPHHFGVVEGHNVGLSSASGSRYVISQVGTDIRPQSTQTRVDTVIAGTADEALHAQVAGIIRAGRLVARGVVKASNLRYEQAFPPLDFEGIGTAARGMTSESFPLPGAVGQTAMVSGTEYFTALPVKAGQVITNLHVAVGTAGAGVTFGKLALMDLAGNRLATSVDKAATFQGTGIMTAALAAPYVVPSDGVLYATVLVTFTTTAPQLLRSHNVSGGVSSVNSGARQHGTAGTGLSDFAADPATLGTGGALGFWFGSS